jgi:hypothetical protein
MAMEQFKAPALMHPPEQYDRPYFDQLTRALRLYFSQIDSLAASKAFSYRAEHFYGGNAELTDVTADTATIGAATVNTLDFNPADVSADQMARLRWNSAEETLNLGMAFGVVQQVGLETYARVANNTGVTIPNGTVVGFAGVGADHTLAVAPYLADGSTPTLYILGVLTHDLPDSGEVGYCTVWGHVHTLNTSAFSVGDILYASPTVAGALTNAKPTAPNNVVPVAAVLRVGTTDGVIFVRPTIQQQKYYGTFSDTTTQSPAAIYTPQAITFNTTDVANGFSRGTPTSRITASVSGYYNFQFSLQVSSTSASSKVVWVWPRINGVDVANSNSRVTITGSGTSLVVAWSFAFSLGAGGYFELMFAADDTNVQFIFEAAQTGPTGGATFARPAVPSAILVVAEIQQ